MRRCGAAALRPLQRRSDMDVALVTFGLALIIGPLVILLWGASPLAVSASPVLAGAMNLFGQPYPTYRVFLIVVGFGTYLPRVLAFTLAGFIAAVSGLLVALNSGFASPELLDFATGGNALVAMLVGGPSTVSGPVIGALLYVIGQDQFGATGHLELLTGLAVVVVIVVFSDGVMGFVHKTLRRVKWRGNPLKRSQPARVDRLSVLRIPNVKTADYQITVLAF
jgi:branched-subunit amino acid ABC-type transport system permease component